MKIVCNSSVLITLDKAGILHILKDLFGEILIPKAVRKEVFGRRRFPAFVQCIEISEPIALKVLESNLEAGESEAICLYVYMKRYRQIYSLLMILKEDGLQKDWE